MRVKILFVLLLALALAGCRTSQATDTATDITISLNVTEAPQTVGKFTLIVTLRDAANAPINAAKIEVTGDMTHAGMAPVNGAAQSGAEGRYEIPFEWTMGGDWIVTVKATLPDGRTASRRFDLSVSSQ